MVINKKLKIYSSIILLAWVATEFAYQGYSRIIHFKDGEYKWEEYAVKRNLKELATIQEFVIRDSSERFIFELNPNEGSKVGLPDSVFAALSKLNCDLTSGINFLKTSKNFSFSYHKAENGLFEIRIYAGANFKQNYNGYNFDVVITNDLSVIPKDLSFVRYENSNIYFSKENNSEYRTTPIILRYNCNSYDLIISNLLRWFCKHPLFQTS
jgi:hypothetical protein